MSLLGTIVAKDDIVLNVQVGAPVTDLCSSSKLGHCDHRIGERIMNFDSLLDFISKILSI